MEMQESSTRKHTAMEQEIPMHGQNVLNNNNEELCE